MSNWELSIKSARSLLLKTFPDIFKELGDDGLLIANGIEALNVVAYGNAGIVNLKNKKIYRIGEPSIYRGTIEEFSPKGWVPLTYPPIIKKLKEEGLSSILEKENIPLFFTNMSFFDNTPEIILRTVEDKNFESEFVIVWGKYVGESFWEYFSTLALRSAGVITGYLGTTGADVHGYYLPELNLSKTFEYQWSIFMFHIASLLENVEYKTFGKKSSMVQKFSKDLKEILGNFPAGIVVEAESSAYSTRSHAKNSGIGQVLKYLEYSSDYHIGYVSGPGADESCLVHEEKEKIGIISCREDGFPVLLNPKIPNKGNFIGENLLKWVTDRLKKTLEFSRKEL